MQVGVVFPQTEIGADPVVVRAYAAAVEELGYAHILAYDHVLGADPAGHPGWSGTYDVNTQFHEPFVLYGYLAAITSLELVTGVIILPQRQTALVAKQAAEVDLLTEGRFRLGVGLGWNAVEYEAGRLADGWFPQWRPGPRVDEAIESVRAAAQASGRDPDSIGMEGRVGLSDGVDDAAAQIQAWQALGASHVAVNTMGIGAGGVDRHIAALAEVARAIGLPPKPIS
jgi:alkanesulfonate monooxygenase SsuD/methylene tetrahydromethanopterin reductase-like flavin-dependent oxidoreductase (luciferase family)